MTSDFLKDERREQVRLGCICSAIIRSLNQSYTGVIKNISIGGLGLESVDQLPQKTECTFEFVLPNGPFLKITGEVCWKFPKGETYLYGIRFNNPGLYNFFRLKFYIKKLLKSRNIAK